MNDFLVIGGGIAGLSAAARLSKLGKVTLLEREDNLGYHASGRSAALFEEGYGKPSTTALNRASFDYLQAADVLSPRGLLLVGTAENTAEFDADLADMSMTSISPEAALDIVPILRPDVITRAAFHDGAMDIDTDALLQHFAREIRSNGSEVIPKFDVSEIEKTQTGWRVGDFVGAILVNAAGAWADQIAALARIAPLGLTPLRRSMGRIPAPGDQDISKWPMIFGPGENWYAKPDAGALIVSPAEEFPCEPHDAYADDLTLAEGFARYEFHVTEPVTRLLASWAGLRTFAPDRQLVLGPDPSDPSFVWSAGQGGYGFQTSPAASQLIADLINGTPAKIAPEIVANLTPNRLR